MIEIARDLRETIPEASFALQIRYFKEEDTERWDAFVEHCPEATFFHRTGWKMVLERAFNHQTHYLLAQRGEHIEGVLPLAQIRSRLFGNALISIPFCVYGGVAAQTEEARQQLIEAGVELANELKVDYLELRNRSPQNPEWPCKDLYVTFRKAIEPDSEANLKAIPRKQRAMVRKGIKAGLYAVEDHGIERFYHVYSTSVRNLGTPVFSKKYFQALFDIFGRDCQVLTIEGQGRVVASVMSFYFRNEVLPYYGGGTNLARELKGNDFMYWELMCRAAETGIRWFDYGRSKVGTGSYSFKKNWGFEPKPLSYEFALVRSNQVPDVSPLNSKYHFFIEAWKRLPLGVSQAIGPWISRNLG